ncbi:hypothetical protein ABGV42_01395 [Paenibacillus pabuli]|uniref:hypothetical protein n=1 Tax=Paenibacillus pabuli TaxID=1472 RepID=UPI003242B3D3
MYTALIKTDIDSILETISQTNDFDSQHQQLADYGFHQSEIARKGVYSRGILMNDKYLIKFFSQEPYIYDNFKSFSGFTEYGYLKQLQSFGIEGVPHIYGYAEDNFMMVEFCGLMNLRKDNISTLNLIEAENLLRYLYGTFWSIYTATGTIPDDMLQKNIVISDGKFTFVDYSAVSAFNSAYFAKSYLVHRLNFLFLRMYRAEQLNAHTYQEIKKQLDLIENTSLKNIAIPV